MFDLNHLSALAEQFIASSPLNVVKDLRNMVIWEAPIFAAASADDPLFIKLKDPDVIGPHHLTPQEWLPEARSVICYFLPFSSDVRKANYGKGFPALEWVYGRVEGESCNDALRRFLCGAIEKSGGKAVAPVLDPRFKVVDEFSSNWSERHAAFIAGLGTFSLTRSLISRKGCAGRYGSVITDLKLEPTPRPYKDVYEYCKKCGVCIPRCPVDAITLDKGKENLPCAQFSLHETGARFSPRYGCGKCQTAVPCESRIP